MPGSDQMVGVRRGVKVQMEKWCVWVGDVWLRRVDAKGRRIRGRREKTLLESPSIRQRLLGLDSWGEGGGPELRRWTQAVPESQVPS